MSLRETYQSRKNLLAANLTQQGVTASGSEGLTTLINKVLEISPAPPTPVLDHFDVELIDGKNILSYADEQQTPHSQYAAVLFTAYDSNDDLIPGLEFDFSVTGESTVSAVCDNNGEYTYTYYSQGIGDVEISASKTVEGSLVSKTYDVQDCTDYQPLTSNAHQSRWTIPSEVSSSSTFGYSSNGWKFGNSSAYGVIELNNVPSVPYSVEFYISSIGNATQSQPIVYLKNGNSWVSILVGGASNNTTFMGDSINRNTNANTLVRIELEANEQRLYFNDVLISTKTKSLSSLPLTFHTGSNRWIEIKDFKIKPL